MSKVNPTDILKYEPRFKSIELSEIMSANGTIVGFHANALGASGGLGSGCSSDKNTAIAIALSESIERAIFRKINDHLKKEFLLDLYPSSCGFAAGLDSRSAENRANLEAIERWCWSKWIDSGFAIDEVIPDSDKLSRIGEYFAKSFNEVRCFQRQFYSEDLEKNLVFSVALGMSREGIFPGSRVVIEGCDPWEHAFVEAWRHYMIYNNCHKHYRSDLVINRIKYFGQNGNEALKAISYSKMTNWPKPKIFFSKQLLPEPEPFYLFRAICDDYIGWHLGDEKRFVY